jgi:uncharacterized protein (TIGR03067 family)
MFVVTWLEVCMRILFCMASVLGLSASLAAPAATGDGKQEGLKQLQGAWRVVKAEPARADGTPAIDPTRFIFKGNKLVLTDDDGTERKETTVKVDPKAKPAHIDLQRGKGKRDVLGIYEVKGDTLRICFSERLVSVRPTEFKAVSDPEGSVVLVTLKPVKKQDNK